MQCKRNNKNDRGHAAHATSANETYSTYNTHKTRGASVVSNNSHERNAQQLRTSVSTPTAPTIVRLYYCICSIDTCNGEPTEIAK